jgi:hypothetical protein
VRNWCAVEGSLTCAGVKLSTMGRGSPIRATTWRSQVHARSDGSVERTATIRVMKSGINDLGSFFTDAKNDGLAVDGPKLIGDEYFELA